MTRRYKIDINDVNSFRDVVDKLARAGVAIESSDIRDFVENERRITVFENAGETMRKIFYRKDDNVNVNKENDTIGGEITVSTTDVVLYGENLTLFTHALRSANEIEFTSFVDGHTELGLIYTDLMSEGVNQYEN